MLLEQELHAQVDARAQQNFLHNTWETSQHPEESLLHSAAP